MPNPSPPSLHRIRLQGPWEWAVPTPSPALAWTWNRIRLPDEWDRLPTMTGPVWFRRRFRSPTGITPTDRLFVVIPTARQSLQVILNGQMLDARMVPEQDSPPLTRCDITRSLADRNLLEVVFGDGISPSEPDSELARPVAIEIESVAGT